MPVENVIGYENITCHHPQLCNLYDCEIGEESKIGTFVEIGAGVKVGKRCKIQSFVFIPWGVTIEDDVFIGPHVTFCNVKRPNPYKPANGNDFGRIHVCKGAVIGAGSVILPGVAIGENAIVGAGSVVTKTVPSGATVMGNPAR